MYEEEIVQLKTILDTFQKDDIIDCHILGTLEEVIDEIEASA